MDLSKAKIVIITLLVFFNAFLLYNNLSYSTARGIQKETIVNAVNILKSRGITLETSISSKTVQIKKLEYGNGVLDKDAIARTLMNDEFSNSGNVYESGDKKLEFITDTKFIYTDGNPSAAVNVNNPAEAQKYALNFLENAGLTNGKYRADSTVLNRDGSNTMTFIEKYEGYFVFDNTCTVTISEKGIKRLEYSKLQIIKFSPEKIGIQAAAYQALLANYQENSRQVITAIDIGYKYPEEQSMEDVETSEILPVWRVRKEIGKVDYLSTAYTNDIGPGSD